MTLDFSRYHGESVDSYSIGPLISGHTHFLFSEAAHLLFLVLWMKRTSFEMRGLVLH